MNRSNIHQLEIKKQGNRESTFMMDGTALLKLAHSAIREHGKYKGGSYFLDASSMPAYEKKLFISYFADSEERELACKSSVALEAVFAEYEEGIQAFIDGECFEVYREDMEEMGMHLGRHNGSDEIYWARR